MPKNKISKSIETPGPQGKKDLYLQGDFHGYDSTEGRQRVEEFSGTGIMLHRNTMSKDAIVTYRYIELDPGFRGRTPTQHHGSNIIEEPPTEFFPKTTKSPKVVPSQTKNTSGKFWGKYNLIADGYSTHRPPDPGNTERIFRVSPVHSHLPGGAVDWPTLLSAPKPDEPKNSFVYHDTVYSDLKGNLTHCNAPVTAEYTTPQNLFSSAANSPYFNFTRSIHVFKPTSGKIDNVVVVNDGIAYLSTGIMDHFEKMVQEGKLSPNTAFVFVHVLPGLAKTIPVNDPKASLPGMGERTIDFGNGIENYVDFIANKLLPGLETQDFTLPKAASRRVMMGSSLSGTASIYIGEKHPDLFGAVIAQSPSPSNRWILKDIVAEYDPSKPRADIHLSSGRFERPGFADNTNFPYAQELSQKLAIPLQEGDHGHQFLAWILELVRSLPKTLTASPTLDVQDTPAVQLTPAKKTEVGPDVMITADESVDPRQTSSPIPKSQLTANHEQTQQFRDRFKEMRAPAESSKAKERKVFNPTPAQTTPKPPWKP